MGAMKELYTELTNGEQYDFDTLTDEVLESPLYNLIVFFGNINYGADAWEQGHTVESLIKEYGDMNTEYVYALIKKDSKYV